MTMSQHATEQTFPMHSHPTRPQDSLRDYLGLIRYCIGTGAGAGLYGYDRNWLLRHGARVYTGHSVIDGTPGPVIAGIHGFRRGALGELRGAVTHHRFQCQGLATWLAANAARDICLPGPAQIRCWVRILPTGRPLERSHRLFSRLGFRDEDEDTFQIKGDYFDCHLAAHADNLGYGDPALEYRSLRMVATSDSILEHTEEFLSSVPEGQLMIQHNDECC